MEKSRTQLINSNSQPSGPNWKVENHLIEEELHITSEHQKFSGITFSFHFQLSFFAKSTKPNNDLISIQVKSID